MVKNVLTSRTNVITEKIVTTDLMNLIVISLRVIKNNFDVRINFVFHHDGIVMVEWTVVIDLMKKIVQHLNALEGNFFALKAELTPRQSVLRKLQSVTDFLIVMINLMKFLVLITYVPPWTAHTNVNHP